MLQVNMFEAKNDLSKLVKSLEEGQQKVIYIARNGNPIVQMTLIDGKTAGKRSRIGGAKGLFTIPDDFDKWDDEVAEMFEES